MKIVIAVGDDDIVLSVDEAKGLWLELNQLFKTDYNYFKPPYTVTCDTNTDELRNFATALSMAVGEL